MFSSNSNFKISDDYKVIYSTKGHKPLCLIENRLLTYKYGKCYFIDLENFNEEFICDLPLNNRIKFLSKSRLMTRLLRLEPRGVVKVEDNNILFSFKGYIYYLNIKNKVLKPIHKFRKNMSAPLYLTAIKGIKNFTVKYCYGEYFSNPEKNEVSIYGCYENIFDWRELYRFKKGEINHIHSIIPDPYQDRVWIFTGDFGDAASIWYTDDDFKTVQKYLSGDQQYRACVGMPTKEGLIYATDTPLEDNNIYLISRNKRVKKLYELQGSSIYGANFNNKLVLSTVVEGHSDEYQGKLNLISYKRGRGIKSWYSHLVIGNLEEGFKTIGVFKKDLLPMGLMQFGTLTFPYGENFSKKIVMYGISLKSIDGKLIVLESNDDRNIKYH